MPIYVGIIEEIRIINAMCVAILKPKIFLRDFTEGHPDEFGFFPRPTLTEFNHFITVADKILSDNLNKTFFRSWPNLKLASETEKDGKVHVQHKGTISLLEEWLTTVIEGVKPDDVKTIISPFCEIRKLRQKPAHVIESNVFDTKYFDQQRTLAQSIYVAVRYLRLLFWNHPLARGVEVPDYLNQGKLANY